MRHALRILVQDFGWIHTGLGGLGNFMFFLGSIYFLPAFEYLKTVGVWLFIVGALLMLIGSIGDFAVKILEARGKSQWREKPQHERGRQPG